MIAALALAAHHHPVFTPATPGSTVGGGAGLGAAVIVLLFFWLVGSRKIPPGK